MLTLAKSRAPQVKCSGTQPCTLCSESGRLCEFDINNRGRRGPRPRQPAAQAEKVIRPLAPRRPSPEHALVAPVNAVPGAATKPGWRPPEVQETEDTGMRISDDSDDDDDESGGSEDEDSMPDPSLWKPVLEKLTHSDDSILKAYVDDGEFWPIFCYIRHRR